jgi:hypothetical protein
MVSIISIYTGTLMAFNDMCSFSFQSKTIKHLPSLLLLALSLCSLSAYNNQNMTFLNAYFSFSNFISHLRNRLFCFFEYEK